MSGNEKVVDMEGWALDQLTRRYLEFATAGMEGPQLSDVTFYWSDVPRVSRAHKKAVEVLLNLASSPLISDEARDKAGVIGAQRLSLKQICADLEALTGEHSPATHLELFTAARMMMRRMAEIQDDLQ